MSLPKQFTTTPNNMPAPTWVGEGYWWNPEYLAHIEKRDAAEKRKSAEVHELKLTTPHEWNGNTLGKRKYRERICIVESCGRRFIPAAPRQRTCGSEECKQLRKQQTTAKWYQRTKKGAA